MRSCLVLTPLALAAGLTGCGAAESPDELLGVKHPLSEYSVRMAACLVEHGWDATTTYDNGVTPAGAGVPRDEEDAYLKDSEECTRRLGYEEPRTPTDDQLREAYRRTLAARQCLVDEGQDIPPVPSEDEFIEQYRAGDSWEVSLFVRMDEVDDPVKLVGECVPPEWFPNW